MAELLITQRFNWADEISFNGFEVVSEDWWNDYCKAVRQPTEGEFLDWLEWPCDCYVGSNQSITFENADKYLQTFKSVNISDSDAEVLKRLLGGAFGKMLWIE